MAIYLQVRAGPLGVLLDALRVHEVVLLPEGLREDQAFAAWRDQVLPVVRLAAHLELSGGACAQAVVYSPGDDQPLVMLLVDEVMRLRPLEPLQWQGLPRVPARTGALFDAVHWDDGLAMQLYRLRSPLDAQQLGVSPAQPLPPGLSAPTPT